MNHIFDIDGTLTDIRKPILKKHKNLFLKWSKTHPFYIVTGSDYRKAIEQLGYEILSAALAVFTCNGGIGHIQGGHWYTKEWRMPTEVFDKLFLHLKNSQFRYKVGHHLEDRHAMYNFSIPGRNCSKSIREEYIEWDKKTNERAEIVKDLNKIPGVNAVIGGQLGIDIMPPGLNKNIIIKDRLIQENQQNIFVCNESYPGGNDYELGKLVHKVINVTNIEQTYDYIQNRP
jgi:hydroxymethylpyrimidine pyrophosphatase-like HAD family hydrolase